MTKLKFTLPFWKADGALWYCETPDLLQAIQLAGVSEEHIRRRMGFGYCRLSDALDGKRIDAHAVALVESALQPDNLRKTLAQ